MSDTFNEFKREAKLYINNSNWLLDECDKIMHEFSQLDYDEVEEEYLNNLMVRMTYLQGKINAEKRLYDTFVENNEEFME